MLEGDDREAEKLRYAGGGGWQRPVWHVFEPIKTDSHSAAANTHYYYILVILYRSVVDPDVFYAESGSFHQQAKQV
jgi:hypothetical protein